nr:MAG TPA: hypothetical protein [Caudoviricetes sp.]
MLLNTLFISILQTYILNSTLNIPLFISDI